MERNQNALFWDKAAQKCLSYVYRLAGTSPSRGTWSQKGGDAGPVHSIVAGSNPGGRKHWEQQPGHSV